MMKWIKEGYKKNVLLLLFVLLVLGALPSSSAVESIARRELLPFYLSFMVDPTNDGLLLLGLETYLFKTISAIETSMVDVILTRVITSDGEDEDGSSFNFAGTAEFEITNERPVPSLEDMHSLQMNALQNKIFLELYLLEEFGIHSKINNVGFSSIREEDQDHDYHEDEVEVEEAHEDEEKHDDEETTATDSGGHLRGEKHGNDNKNHKHEEEGSSSSSPWRVPVLVTFLVVATIMVIALAVCIGRLLQQIYKADNDSDDDSSSSSSDDDVDSTNSNEKKDNEVTVETPKEGNTMTSSREIEGGSTTEVEEDDVKDNELQGSNGWIVPADSSNNKNCDDEHKSYVIANQLQSSAPKVELETAEVIDIQEVNEKTMTPNGMTVSWVSSLPDSAVSPMPVDSTPKLESKETPLVSLDDNDSLLLVGICTAVIEEDDDDIKAEQSLQSSKASVDRGSWDLASIASSYRSGFRVKDEDHTEEQASQNEQEQSLDDTLTEEKGSWDASSVGSSYRSGFKAKDAENTELSSRNEMVNRLLANVDTYLSQRATEISTYKRSEVDVPTYVSARRQHSMGDDDHDQPMQPSQPSRNDVKVPTFVATTGRQHSTGGDDDDIALPTRPSREQPQTNRLLMALSAPSCPGESDDDENEDEPPESVQQKDNNTCDAPNSGESVDDLSKPGSDDLVPQGDATSATDDSTRCDETNARSEAPGLVKKTWYNEDYETDSFVPTEASTISEGSHSFRKAGHMISSGMVSDNAELVGAQNWVKRTRRRPDAEDSDSDNGILPIQKTVPRNLSFPQSPVVD